MIFRPRLPPRLFDGPRLAVLIALLGLPAAACAQTPGDAEPGGVEGLLRAAGIKHGPIAAKDFVVKSRASAPRHDFMPVGVTPPDHAVRVKTPEEIEATTASLDALRGGHGRPAGSKPAAPRRKAAHAVSRQAPEPLVIRGPAAN